MSGKKFRVGSVLGIPMVGEIMHVILVNRVWQTTPVIKVEELESDGKPRVFRAETANTIYVLACFE